MAEIPQAIDYDALATTELELAKLSTTPAERREHLDQAAVYATHSERERFAHAEEARGQVE